MNGLDLDGSKLIDRVFAGDNPTIQFVDLVTQTGRDIQHGLYLIFKDAVQSIQNPNAHGIVTSRCSGMLRIDLATLLAGRFRKARPVLRKTRVTVA